MAPNTDSGLLGNPEVYNKWVLTGECRALLLLYVTSCTSSCKNFLCPHILCATHSLRSTLCTCPIRREEPVSITCACGRPSDVRKDFRPTISRTDTSPLAKHKHVHSQAKENFWQHRGEDPAHKGLGVTDFSPSGIFLTLRAVDKRR